MFGTVIKRKAMRMVHIWYEVISSMEQEMSCIIKFGSNWFFNKMTQCHEADSFWNNHAWSICALSTEFETCCDRHGPSLRRYHNFNCLTLGFRDRRQSLNVVWWPFCSFTLSWWRHQMETFSRYWPFCGRNSPVTGEFPAQRVSDAGLWCFLCYVQE